MTRKAVCPVTSGWNMPVPTRNARSARIVRKLRQELSFFCKTVFAGMNSFSAKTGSEETISVSMTAHSAVKNKKYFIKN